MATDTQKIALRMDADPRLVAAAGGVARYFADAAGLDNAAVSDLQSATVGVCTQEIEKPENSNRGLEIVVTRSPDRIEVAVITTATSDAAAEKQAAKTIPGVDQVESELRADTRVTRLTKYVNAAVSGT